MEASLDVILKSRLVVSETDEEEDEEEEDEEEAEGDERGESSHPSPAQAARRVRLPVVFPRKAP